MKKLLVGMISISGIFLGCVRDDAAAEPATDEPTDARAEPATEFVANPAVDTAIGEEEKKTLERFFHRILDLSRPELAPIREAVEKQKYAVAAELYQRRFIYNISQMELGKPWVYYTANSAADLMADTVKWKKGGGRIEQYHLGSPGSYVWWPATMNGQFTEWTEVHRMNFTHVLPNEFVKTGDVDYMRKWGMIWSDFIDNNFRQWKVVMSDRRTAREEYGQAVANPWKHMLYIMWRVDAFVQQLGVAATHSPEETMSAIDANEFIKMLVFMHDQCDSLKSQLRPGSTPNQLNGCSAKLLRAAKVFDDFQDSPAWREAVDRAWIFTLSEGAVLPDGSDVEMSFGYLPQIIYSPYRMLPFFPVGELPGWMDDLMLASRDRFRFLACATSPGGFLPNLATEPGRNRKEDWHRLHLETNQRDPLIGWIHNQIWGEDTAVPEPAFTSTAFPYGGSYVLRNGWEPGSHYLYFIAARNGRGHKDNCGNAVILEAFGRKLLVDSGTYRVLEPFPEKEPIRRYLTSSFAHNTISVDGYSQNREDAPMATGFRDTIPARWLNSDEFDFTEGRYPYGYGPTAGVTHQRQILFLRSSGLYILRDILQAEGDHHYTQVWNFDKSFKPEEVIRDSAGRQIRTAAPDEVNLAIFHAGAQPLEFVKYHGSEEPTFGWDFSGDPKVDVQVQWQGEGNQQLLSLLWPYESANAAGVQVQEIHTPEADGFRLKTPEGAAVEYLAARGNLPMQLQVGLISVEGEALLILELDGRISGVVLNSSRFDLDGTPQTVEMSDFSFTVVGNRLESLREIKSPTGFAWQETSEGPVPIYDQTPPEPSRGAAPENLAREAKISFTSFEGEDPAAIAAHLLDGDPDTGWQAAATDPRPAILIEFDSDTTFDMVRVREPSTDRTFTITGAAILDYTIDVWQSGQWRRLAYGESVYPRYESNSHGGKSKYFPVVTARKLRILIRESQKPPRLSEIGIFRVTSSKFNQDNSLSAEGAK